jgi:predicted transcriptional regulator
METVALDVDADVFTAGDLMTAPVVTVGEDEGLVETLRLMRNSKVRRMPVVTRAGTLFGIVTADDIINLLAMELSMMTAAIVEQPMKEGRLRK